MDWRPAIVKSPARKTEPLDKGVSVWTKPSRPPYVPIGSRAGMHWACTGAAINSKAAGHIAWRTWRKMPNHGSEFMNTPSRFAASARNWREGQVGEYSQAGRGRLRDMGLNLGCGKC